MGALSRTLALLVLISLHGGALGLAATGTLSTIGSQEIPKGRSVTGHIPPEGDSVDCTRLCRLPTGFQTIKCIKITSVI